jgi:hypothetical protein
MYIEVAQNYARAQKNSLFEKSPTDFYSIYELSSTSLLLYGAG